MRPLRRGASLPNSKSVMLARTQWCLIEVRGPSGIRRYTAQRDWQVSARPPPLVMSRRIAVFRHEITLRNAGLRQRHAGAQCAELHLCAKLPRGRQRLPPGLSGEIPPEHPLREVRRSAALHLHCLFAMVLRQLLRLGIQRGCSSVYCATMNRRQCQRGCSSVFCAHQEPEDWLQVP